MNLSQKRRNRVERLIDQRMLGFLKPVLASALPSRKRDSLEFLSASYAHPQERAQDKAS